MFKVEEIKKDFPIFENKFFGKSLVYLDNAATTQKPRVMLDEMTNFYTHFNSNIGRSSNFLADLATEKFEQVRKLLAEYLNVENSEIIFTKNSTEGLNLVALSFGNLKLTQGDTVLILTSEHNSNLLPWKNLAKQKDANLEFIHVDPFLGIQKDYEKLFRVGVKFVVVSEVSNVLGDNFPISKICVLAKKIGAYVIVDGSQAVSYKKPNLKKIGCDFYSFSVHKMYGPFGVGVLWGRKELLEQMPPLFLGGGNVKDINLEKDNFKEIPYRFEYGTQDIASVVAFGATLNYLSKFDFDFISAHLENLTNKTKLELSKIPQVKILGTKDDEQRSKSLVSFYIENIHSHDLNSVLSSDGIAARSGLHCAMNLYQSSKIPSATRVSFAIYNSENDLEVFFESLKKALKIFKI